MKEKESILMFVENLNVVFNGGVGRPNDFIALAVAGEQLRRLMNAAEGRYPEAEQALRRYEELLQDMPEQVPRGLDDDLEAALKALEDFAKLNPLRQDPDEGLDILLGIEEVLSVGAACWRAGKLPLNTLESLAARAARKAGELAPRLGKLWDSAQQQVNLFGPDPEIPSLYSFMEELADYSEESALLSLALSPLEARRKKKIIDDVLQRLEQADRMEPGGQVVDLAEKFRMFGERLASARVQEEEEVALAADSSHGIRFVPLAAFDRFEAGWIGERLVFYLPDGFSRGRFSAEIEMGGLKKVFSGEIVSSRFEIDCPPGKIRILKLELESADGDRFVFPREQGVEGQG